MPRTPIASMFAREVQIHRLVRESGRPVDEVRGVIEQHNRERLLGLVQPVSRRHFLTGTGALAAATAGSLMLGRSARAAQPRIVIVGPGCRG